MDNDGYFISKQGHFLKCCVHIRIPMWQTLRAAIWLLECCRYESVCTGTWMSCLVQNCCCASHWQQVLCLLYLSCGTHSMW